VGGEEGICELTIVLYEEAEEQQEDTEFPSLGRGG